MKNSQRTALIHITAVLVFLSLPILFSPDLQSIRNFVFVDGFKRNFACYTLLAAFFYANYYYFIPKFYFTRKLIVFILLLIASYAIIAMLPELIFPPMHHAFDHPPKFDGMHHGPPPMHNFQLPDGGSFFQFLLIVFLSVGLRTTTQLNTAKSEKLKAELSYLKAQINPHFLFNTLNSLYALAISKSDDAPNAVLKLSGIMRYVVTESSKAFVPLEKEMQYIRDYIDLQRLRISDTDKLAISITGNPEGRKIAPLVIIPFIENAFKYGVNAEENWHIQISINITENELIVEIINNQVQINLPGHYATEKGIDNTQNRLDLIYPGKHELTIENNEKTYKVHLKILLS